MLGDTAVAVHPDDERYRAPDRPRDRAAAGRAACIPIIADEHVDPAFGTGAVKITPAHDPNDFEIGRRHDLPMPTIMDESGRHRRHRHALRRHGPVRGPRGGPRGAARRGPDRRGEAALPAQRRARLAHRRRADRAAAVAAVVRQGRAAGQGARATPSARRRRVIHPKELEPRFFDWVDNMHDWCISRQLWWGHRIPVWYGPDGEVVCLGPDEEPPGGLHAGRGRPRHLVLLGAVAVLHAGLAGARHPTWSATTRHRCWSPATTSCSSGSSG